MEERRSSSFAPTDLPDLLSQRSGNEGWLDKIIIIVCIGVMLITGVGMTVPVVCVIVKTGEGTPIRSVRVEDGEAVILSHVNSIYDSEVRETLVVKGESLVLHKVDTHSAGVREYYGIADGLISRHFTIIPFRNSRERAFRLIIGGHTVDQLQEHLDVTLLIEVVPLKLAQYLAMKLGA